MFFIWLIVIFLVLSAVCFWRYKLLCNSGKHTDYDNGGTAFKVVSCILAAICLIVTGVAYVDQIEDFENIKKFKELELVYQAKADVLTVQFVKFLSQEYPAHEREIFKEIGPEKVLLYFAKYPDIQASKTLSELAGRISELQNDIYKQRIDTAEAKKNTRVRLRNPWLITYVMPTE